jgi:hypothetical protein
MANYNTLKAAIQQVVKTNGNNEITGALLQQSLLSMINSLGVGYQFMGIATPSTNPGTPDQNVFYIASIAGTYTNFNGIELDAGEVAFLTYNGAWAKNSSGFGSEEKLFQLSADVFATLSGIKTVECNVPSSGKGVSNYLVSKNKTYIVCLANKGGLGNVYLFSGTGSPYTALSVNNSIEWTPTYDGYLSIYDNTGHTGTPVLTVIPKDSLINPVVFRNGSGANIANTDSVTTEVVPTNGAKFAIFKTNRPNTSGYHYVYGYTLTSSEAAIGSLSGRDSLPGVVGSLDYGETTILNLVDIRPYPTAIGVNMTIAEVNDNGNYNALRVSDFSDYILSIELSNFIDDILQVDEIDSINEFPRAQDFNKLFSGATGEAEPFIFFSDPHFYATYASAIMKRGAASWLQRMKVYFNNTPTNFVLCGGDWLTEHKQSTALIALGQIDGMMNGLFPGCYFPVFGNHDNNYQGELDETNDMSANNGALPNQTMINLWFRKWGKMYYSFKGTATRFYVFDSGLDDNLDMTQYRWEQIDWFARLLLQNNDMHNIVVTHIESVNGYITEFAKNITLLSNAYNNRTTITLNGQTYNFDSVSGKVHCMLCGHTHIDAISTLNNIPVYCITTSMNDGAFDMVLLNYETGELKSIRVGAGTDRTMSLV